MYSLPLLSLLLGQSEQGLGKECSVLGLLSITCPLDRLSTWEVSNQITFYFPAGTGSTQRDVLTRPTL